MSIVCVFTWFMLCGRILVRFYKISANIIFNQQIFCLWCIGKNQMWNVLKYRESYTHLHVLPIYLNTIFVRKKNKTKSVSRESETTKRFSFFFLLRMLTNCNNYKSDLIYRTQDHVDLDRNLYSFFTLANGIVILKTLLKDVFH